MTADKSTLKREKKWERERDRRERERGREKWERKRNELGVCLCLNCLANLISSSCGLQSSLHGGY